MAAAQEHASTLLDTSLEVMAATFAKRVASKKLEEAKDALKHAQDSRTVRFCVVVSMRRTETVVWFRMWISIVPV